MNDTRPVTLLLSYFLFSLYEGHEIFEYHIIPSVYVCTYVVTFLDHTKCEVTEAITDRILHRTHVIKTYLTQ